MYAYYKRSLLKMRNLLRQVQTDPMGRRNDCRLLQEQILATVTRIEKQIRKHRCELKKVRNYLSKPHENRVDNATATNAKTAIQWHRNRIEDYQHLLVTFKSIGDGLAFIYLDKWDIKQFAMKETSGFISGKSGLTFELRIFRLAFSSGGIALLNDLTNCLRHGDLTVLSKGRWLLVEAKSGRTQDSRSRRQTAKLKSMVHYLTYNKTKSIPVRETQEAEFVRLPVHCPEVDYRDQLNALISDARRNTHQYSMVQVEPGLHYLASYGARPEALSTLTGKLPGSLIVSFINELKYDSLGYYPFSLSICDTEAWYDFCSGKLMLCVFVETKAIQDKLSRHGIKSEITGQWDQYPVILTGDESSGKPGETRVGGHFFGRLFYEFVSLDWMLEEFVYWRNHDSDEES